MIGISFFFFNEVCGVFEIIFEFYILDNIFYILLSSDVLFLSLDYVMRFDFGDIIRIRFISYVLDGMCSK